MNDDCQIKYQVLLLLKTIVDLVSKTQGRAKHILFKRLTSYVLVFVFLFSGISPAAQAGEFAIFTKMAQRWCLNTLSSIFTPIKRQRINSRANAFKDGEILDLNNEVDLAAFKNLEGLFIRHHQEQGLVWLYSHSGQTEKSQQLQLKIEEDLSSGDIRKVEKLRQKSEGIEGNSGNIYVVELMSGRKAIFRPESTSGSFDYHQEIATYIISHRLGLDVVPITLERSINGKNGAIQLYMENSVTANVKASYDKLPFAHGSPRIRVLDLLIANRDRNMGNWLYLEPLDYEVGIDATDTDRTFVWGRAEVEWALGEFETNPTNFYPGAFAIQAMNTLDPNAFSNELSPHLKISKIEAVQDVLSTYLIPQFSKTPMSPK